MNPSSSNARLRPFRPVPFGRYTLLTQLATGGMGEIFLARLEGVQGFEKLCVIKKILPQLAEDPEFVERFVGEARTLVKLSHGSIAQVLDMGLHEGEAYMALEYVDGKDLRKVAARARDRQKPLPLTFVLFVMGRVLDALAYAHRKKGDDEGELNLVHRDISPQNILISYEGEVKVIDFGLAKSRLSAAKTNPSIILGKFLYMSPEQARHLPVDRRSDLYAVGLCLYELISGRNPFDQLPPGELMSAVSQPSIPPLSQVVPSVPPALEQLVMKALAVDPAQRFQTAEELRARLNACLLEMDPSSGPESVSRSMHELFGSEYQAERRLLASLREVGRAPEPEPVVIGMPEGVPPRPASTLPPKTIRLDGPVEPLSFRPTPRAREGGPVREEGETRPAVTVMEEPTRPAVAVEAIEESRRERHSPPGGSPTVDVSGLTAPSVPPRPVAPPVLSAEPGSGTGRGTGAHRAVAPSVPPVLSAEPSSGARRGTGTHRAVAPSVPPVLSAEPKAGQAWASEFSSQAETLPSVPAAVPAPPEVVSIEDTPMWSEPLRTDEGPRSLASSPEAREVPPVLSETEEFGPEASSPEAADARLANTDETPLDGTEDAGERSVDVGLEDTQPRIHLPREFHEDTQPRVSLQDVYRQDTQPRVVLDESLLRDSPEEEVTQEAKKKPRRRVTSTGVSVVSPRQMTSSSHRAVPPPGQDKEITRRTSVPTRPGLPWGRIIVVLALLLTGAGVGAAAFFLQHPADPELVEPPPARPLSPSVRKTAPSPSVAAGTAPVPGDAQPAPPAPEEALAAAPVPEEEAETPDAGSSTVEPFPDETLLAPLDAPSPTPSKRPPPRKRATRNPSTLQKEWARTRSAYKALTRVYACESLNFLCSRYEDLEAEVVGMGDVENPELLSKVKALYREIQKRKGGP
ncbi:protein kinase [Archangium violaceum]|uniref:serine/threonine protein kinase n=1 Tax=Archangium violaceum TaxID=83451 RepID=UPI002B2976BA|nr:protein kinase [Archangium violaceum]